jgi:hypothetical protein
MLRGMANGVLVFGGKLNVHFEDLFFVLETCMSL